MKENHRQSKQRQFQRMTFREFLLLVLVGVLFALAIYTARDDHTAFGLLRQPVYADFLPVVTTFQSEALLTKPFLELQQLKEERGGEQVEAVFRDPHIPPPVEDFVALNTRIGGEVALFWRRPDAESTVNIYRKQSTPEGEEEEVLIAERRTEESWIDDDVTNGNTYVYRAVAVRANGNELFTAQTSPTATVVPLDSIPPSAPTEVTVTSVVEESSSRGLLIQWSNPKDADLDHLVIFRSERYGTRGTSIATILPDQPSEYLDSAVTPNTPFFYTVVAVDTAGNNSSDDFQVSGAGNNQPFLPFLTEEFTTEE